MLRPIWLRDGKCNACNGASIVTAMTGTDTIRMLEIVKENTMQLDRVTVKKLDKNGMVVAMVAVYDYELDRSGYEVTKTLTGQLLTRETLDVLEDAEKRYKELALELGASLKEIYDSKIK